MERRAPRLLGIGGLVPFIALALLTVLGTEVWQGRAETALLAYGAVILAFLGGVSWGTGLAARKDLLYLLSLVPFLAAWAALLVPRELGFWLLIAAFLVALANDRAAFRLGLVPAWFRSLRHFLTAVVVVCLLIAALAAAAP